MIHFIKFKSRKKQIYTVKSQGYGYNWRAAPRRGHEGPSGVLITFSFLIFVVVTRMYSLYDSSLSCVFMI